MFSIQRLRWALLIAIFVLAGNLPAFGAGFARVPVYSHSSTDWIFAGARTEALGQADLARPVGPMSTLFNPAPLPEGPGVQVGFGRMNYLFEYDCLQFGLTYERGPWRFSAVRSQFQAKNVPIRTAYNPEGTGETLSVENRAQVFTIGLDVAQLAHPGAPWNWTVGLSHRNYRHSFAEEVSRLDGIDFGSSCRYTQFLERTRIEAAASGVLRNIDKDVYSPESTHFGVALTMAMLNEAGRDLVAVSLMMALQDNDRDEDFFGTDRYGFEITGLEILSLRLGKDSAAFGGTTQWGVGLNIPERWIHPFSLSVDYGSLSPASTLEDEVEDFEGFNVRGRIAL